MKNSVASYQVDLVSKMLADCSSGFEQGVELSHRALRFRIWP